VGARKLDDQPRPPADGILPPVPVSSVRREQGLPSRPTITRDEFLEATTDVRELAPERATRVGRPAPFRVALPTRLIESLHLRRRPGARPVLHSAPADVALVLLTINLAARVSAGAVALAAVTGPHRPAHDVVQLFEPAHRERLRGYAGHGRSAAAR
jgi:hypothetical protein